MALKDQDKSLGTLIVGDKVSPVLAGEIKPYAGDVSSWTEVNGLKIKKGNAPCLGQVVNQADFPDLYAAIGTTWNDFDHPEDGVPTVDTATQFALPNLKGINLMGAGNNGSVVYGLGTYYDDLTNTTGIITNTDTHSHSVVSKSLRGSVPQAEILVTDVSSSSDVYQVLNGVQSTVGDRQNIHSTATKAWKFGTLDDSHSHTLTGGGVETRSKSAGVNYIIAVYDNDANSLSIDTLDVGTITADSIEGDLTGDVNGGTVSADTYENLPDAGSTTKGVVEYETFTVDNVALIYVNSISDARIHGVRINSHVTLSIFFRVDPTDGYTIKYPAIPSSFHPSTVMQFNPYLNVGNQGRKSCLCYVNPDGTIQFWSSSSAETTWGTGNTETGYNGRMITLTYQTGVS